ncbi:MAG TPA: methionyl-tRNA formyltransferase [Gemmatimonadales bacterium]|jgi:methionyl-tRNA formyltransferase|nr:methionyl-tRNA formyltransferase [Gemmatimonadales bacterium]
MVGPGIAPLRIILLGDGAWAALSLERLQATPHQVVAVIGRTRPTDASLAEATRRFGIPLHAPARINAHETIAMCAALAPDLLISVAYNQILRSPVREIARLGAVNFHAGKLPFYRGRNVINWAIINGESEIGLTAHFMDDGIDTGDILLQRTEPIGWTDTYGDVLARVTAAMPDMVAATLDGLVAGTLVARSQRDLPGTYFGGRGDGDEWLDWTDPSEALHNKIRAIAQPGPGARTSLGGQTIVIWRAHFDRSWPRYIATPGQVVGHDRDGVLVKTGDSTLRVRQIETAEGVSIPAWPIGTRLDINRHAALAEHLGPQCGCDFLGATP